MSAPRLCGHCRQPGHTRRQCADAQRDYEQRLREWHEMTAHEEEVIGRFAEVLSAMPPDRRRFVCERAFAHGAVLATAAAATAHAQREQHEKGQLAAALETADRDARRKPRRVVN